MSKEMELSLEYQLESNRLKSNSLLLKHKSSHCNYLCYRCYRCSRCNLCLSSSCSSLFSNHYCSTSNLSQDDLDATEEPLLLPTKSQFLKSNDSTNNWSVQSLSGGERQRISWARLFHSKPKLVSFYLFIYLCS